ncbi:MAG: hypothetical protein AAF531_18920 [Actinomycetota bacterium]
MADYAAYRRLIGAFLSADYEVTAFSDDPPDRGKLLLRHDIDFDVRYASEMSFVEDDLGVTATYFFLLRSASYNLLDADNLSMITSMRDRGHRVSLHFDPTLYDDVETGFQEERRIFENACETTIEHVSIHRPSDYFLGNPERIAGVTHTYHPKLFEDIKYFADSQGRFRYGHPLESSEFADGRTIQLLIHPIWWKHELPEPVDKLRTFLSERIDRFEGHMAANCAPYRDYLDQRS